MIEIAMAGASVLSSLAVCLLVMRMLWNRPLETRGMAGLGLTVLHMAFSLVIPAAGWIALRPQRPALFALSVLVFYLVSLIILVVAIIRWLQTGSVQRNGSPNGPAT